MIIGYLRPATNGTPPELFGEIKTLNFQEEINFVPIPTKSAPNAPDYEVFARADIKIGAAWKKTKQEAGGKVTEFLSFTIDDPSMVSALNVAAFPKGDGSYDISWRRRNMQQNQNETA